MKLWIKTIYNGLMFGMPTLTYNPISKVKLIAPFTVSPNSMYINYELNSFQKDKIQNHIHDYNSSLNLVPISIDKLENPKYYLSLNIYNCTSPLFLTDANMTRFEINTYVSNGKENGTLILDYISSSLSMDPVNIFKISEAINYTKNQIYTNTKNISLFSTYNFGKKDKRKELSEELTLFTDKIFYLNGIYDRVYYDSSLVNAKIKVPKMKVLFFNFLNMTFNSPFSVFYFCNPIFFAGTMWANFDT